MPESKIIEAERAKVQEMIGAHYPHIQTWSKRRLERELRMIQDFLADENSSVGRADLLWEQALIFQLNSRDAKHVHDHDSEDCEWSDCIGCGRTVRRCVMNQELFCKNCRL